MTAIGSTEFSDEIENFVKHVMQRYETEKITEFAQFLLECVHIKIASKIIASIITAIKVASSLS